MKRLLMVAAAAVLLLSRAIPAFAAADPSTMEVKWIEKTVSITTTGVTSFTFDPGGYGAAGFAVVGGTKVSNGTDGTTQGSTVAVVAADRNVVGFDWSFLAQGSTATLKIAQTTATPAPRGLTAQNRSSFDNPFPASYYLTAPSISTSSAIMLPAGVQYYHAFRAQVTNPVFILSSLTAASTYTLTVNVGYPK